MTNIFITIMFLFPQPVLITSIVLSNVRIMVSLFAPKGGKVATRWQEVGKGDGRGRGGKGAIIFPLIILE